MMTNIEQLTRAPTHTELPNQPTSDKRHRSAERRSAALLAQDARS